MRRAYAVTASVPDSRPIAELNITPLIDVMLVLLVMFIIAVPAMTHQVPVDLPQPGPVAPAEREVHLVAISRGGQASLDGVAIADAALADRLRPLAGDERTAVLFRPDPQTRYERADQVLAEVKRAGVTRLAFDGIAGMAE